MPITLRLHNRYRINRTRAKRGNYPYDDAISGARIFLYPINNRGVRTPFSNISDPHLTTTSRDGRAVIEFPNQSGTYILRVLPDQWSSDEVNPALGASFTTIPDRIYRPLDIKFKFNDIGGHKFISDASVKSNVLDGEVISQTGRTIDILLQPVWMTDFTGNRRTRNNIDLIILHLTSGSDPYGAVRKIASKTGAHYLILKEDGQIIKFLRDEIVGHHAGSGGRPGNSYWRGDTDINSRSIGIELENVKASGSDPDFSESQYRSLLGLLRKIVSRYGIDRRRIIGHSDIAVWLDIKSWDPGLRFDWPRLDRNGFGLIGPGRGYPSLTNLMAVGGSAYGNYLMG